MDKRRIIVRDISWLAFNARVLQEAGDETVPLKERIRFLGIFSNNLDEFFRVRVATLKRMIELGSKANMHLETTPEKILEEINVIVTNQQNQFNRTWTNILQELKKQKIFLVTEKQLNREQQKFVLSYFNDSVRSNIVPLMIENINVFPTLNDKSIYLACKLSAKDESIPQRFALVSVPSRLPRFIILPSTAEGNSIILLEDVIRFCLPNIFAYFGYDTFSSNIIKVTRDAEIDIDNDVSTSFIQKIQKGLKNRKKGKPVRFIFDKDIDSLLLNYLIKRLGLTNKDNIQSGGRIHNYKDFINFPDLVFEKKNQRKKPFIHPSLQNANSVTNVILEKDVLLSFPYHSFDPVIDLLIEAAIAPDVMSIKLTCYRLAPRSTIINALTNAVRNGKSVTVVLELRARFDEEANLEWKERLEEAGVKVFLGAPNLKVHAKLCLIKKRINNHTIHFGFVSTGNLNEKTATMYGDHCLLTSNRHIMADVNRMFNYLENPKNVQALKACKKLIPSPVSLRKQLHSLIDKEIKSAREGKHASIILKLNSLSDEELILKLYDAARAGVKIKMIIRGICCMLTENKKFKKKIKAISIVDEYLEHARVMIFHHDGKEKVFISSADWMVRNIDHRVEATCPIYDKEIQEELKDILNIQLNDNVKARILDNDLSNIYVENEHQKKIRSQIETYNYLLKKKHTPVETGSN
ncbi:polyphosphate kinase 1 [Ginsengibacter hankyongi]|uniref:Polyphosphate kinase n=1 Tax=Ginsengibacter hankyongi TaxID=2607284 RepID=A0A5J5IAA0_9BACT|nr:polyphosphate kinase 1 [Ginsengibacter hankyongi]KAA9034669.1 polyphosphate kinase 1 [Ginsengibacter hankyongi]